MIFDSTARKGYISAVMLICGLIYFGFYSFAERRVESPIINHLKQRFNQPTLSPKIKVFSFDDNTASKLKKYDLSLSAWAQIFKTISDSQPKMILIDKLFDSPDFSKEDIEKFNRIVKGIKTPIVNIGFIRESPLKFRHAGSQQNTPPFKKGNINEYLEQKPHFYYGANPSINASFETSGHANYLGNDRIRALVRTGENEISLHWALQAANEISFENNQLKINSHTVHTDKYFNAGPEILGSDYLFANSYSLLTVVVRHVRGLPIDVVNPGDYVVILPAMFTGNTDFADTSLGSMPGGFVMVSALNSVLTNKWISYLGASPLTATLCFVIGFILPFRTKNTKVIAGLITASYLLAWIALSLFWSIHLPVVLPLLALLLPVTIGLDYLQRVADIKQLRMEHELETAQIVQESFMAETSSQNLLIKSWFRPSAECGGDYWRHFNIGQNEYLIIADATGHGAPAALVTAMIFSLIESARKLIIKGDLAPDPASILSYLNSIVSTAKNNKATLTCQIIRFDFSENVLTIANGGHCHPIIIPSLKTLSEMTPSAKRVSSLVAKGGMLGISEGEVFTNETRSFTTGERLLLYSDGIYEVENERKQCWGKREFLRYLSDLATCDTSLVVSNIQLYFESFLGGHQADDDVTVIGIEIR